MASRYGGKIVTDGLVLCLDAHDAKSYAGEPANNLVTSTAVDYTVRSTYSGNTFSQVDIVNPNKIMLVKCHILYY